jgi:photosystem II stability/assembly factor-like uncharacterized protein
MKKLVFLLLAFATIIPCSDAQRRSKKKSEPTKVKTILDKTSFSGLKFRALGPALTSGRISDIAVHPKHDKIYYVASASGGVWKTVNAGTTFKPIFDSQGSYSIGCVTIDPNNPETVWVGSGENNNQRSVAYGDGIYKSVDAGKTWKNMGLKNSEHIGKIIVHPENSDVIFVAAIGPLWSSGGDRGVYKSTDGGKTWKAVLTIDQHTGVNDIVMDETNPDILYAAAYQRRRHVFTYLGGGPSSGMYRSLDGGETWTKSSDGLPKVDIGRIGLTTSPANPDYIYAIVEAAQGKGGIFRSTNKGLNWSKRGKYTTSGNYYQEIIADPNNSEKLYIMDTWMKVSYDGGKSVKHVGEVTKHVDNHSLWIDPTDTQHLLSGCDGGIYETWDGARTWQFKANLPVIQFYKVVVDDSEPFYNIYGGTQDNFSLGGPARSTSGNGIVNEDWFITHGGDGFESAVDPFNPDIVYAQSQYGVLVRYDKRSGEELGIQPKERRGEPSYRWNWDAPLSTSAHKEGRIYFAANKLFRSDDRGNSWQVLSGDLTRRINRNELKVMDRIWGVDAIAKNGSTSPYGTIVAFSESPIYYDLLYVGTDDGLIQITTDAGANWTKVESFSGVPEKTYVNAVLASRHDENVVYACFNNHKNGDFKPYVYRSDDRGKSWTNISSNLPSRGSTYSIEEDHVDPDLLFVGTEFGVFFSNNGGKEWKQLKSGVPTIAVRDIAIQRRENDLVLGTFGRGFFVLDDYSALRNLKSNTLATEASLLPVRDALQFEYSYPLGLPGKSFQGDSYYSAPNLGPYALFTYYMQSEIKTREERRRDREKEAAKTKQANPFPTYEDYLAEKSEDKPYLLFTIRNSSDEVVRKLVNKPKKGVNRIKWDLRYSAKNPVSFSKPPFYNPFAGKKKGPFVEPGRYSVEMSKSVNGQIVKLGTKQYFQVKSLDNNVLPVKDPLELVTFKQEVSEFGRNVQNAQRTLSDVKNKLKHIRQGIKQIEIPHEDIYTDITSMESKIRDIKKRLNGDNVATRLDIDTSPSVASRLGWINYEQNNSRSEPTKTHRASLKVAKDEFVNIAAEISNLVNTDMNTLLNKMKDAGSPYVPGLPFEYSKD